MSKVKTLNNLKDYLKVVEQKYLKEFINLDIGDILKLSYLVQEGEKERIQSYEGLLIAIKNKGLGKSFTIRRTIDGIGVEQVFLINSPKLISIVKKQSSKVRRAKLYYLRKLEGKSSRLKRKF